MNDIHLLIVDNDQVNSFVLRNIINRNYEDVSVTILSDGAKALEHLRGLEEGAGSFPAIILLDIYMPVMDGFEFLDQYVERYAHRNTVIFAMSNSLIKEDQQKANKYNVVKGFITKPLIYNNIQFIMDTYLQGISDG